jgi:hypothetical protein
MSFMDLPCMVKGMHSLKLKICTAPSLDVEDFRKFGVCSINSRLDSRCLGRGREVELGGRTSSADHSSSSRRRCEGCGELHVRNGEKGALEIAFGLCEIYERAYTHAKGVPNTQCRDG